MSLRSTIDSQEVDDLELVTRTRAGDRASFDELVNRHAAKVFRLARHITRNDAEAEDFLQDAFYKAYTRLDQFNADAQFYTWLVRIAVNEALMRLRKRRNNKTVSLDAELETEDGSLRREAVSPDDNPEQEFSRDETRKLLEEAIDSLDEGYRTVFVLRDVEGMSTQETADLLELSISAVKSRLLRARLQLRDKLKGRLHSHG
ncbi:MAG: RNA polymerase sigma factor [Acidobacteria bacterium]|nr:RNA polymerase sigma factor [Acidobacteriota bacterium]MDA1235979.1 RNA polymerase sigma factor [Acidobacteriota bacterium]